MAHTLLRDAFERNLNGQRTRLVTLRGAGGLQVVVCNHGARLTQIAVPDAQGDLVDVALGYDSLDGYLNGQQSMGATIGRWAGRLRRGMLTLPDGPPVQLPTSSGPHHHHGGPRGSRFQVFEVGDVQSDAMVLHHVFRTEDDGVPGTIRLTLHLTITPDNALEIAWTAEAADAPTVVNITGHAFFNLAGRGSAHGHVLHVPAGRYVPLATDVCPTGTLESVHGTPFDFRQSRRLGDAIAAAHTQLSRVGGLDHFLVLDDLPAVEGSQRSPTGIEGLRRAAVLSDPGSGRSMEVWSTAPGVQVYAGHGLKGDPARDLGRGPGAKGWLWQSGDGICLEPMEYPDAPNQRSFPYHWMSPGEVRHGNIVYRFH